MRMKRVGLIAMAFGVALAMAATTYADTLTLKDGRVIQGRYIGGTADTIQMEVNGEVHTYNVRDVQGLSRDSNTAPAAPSGYESAPAPAPREREARKVTVPAGTRILVRMIDGVDSETSRVGDRFRASLETNLEQDGWLLARRGSDVYGRLVDARGAGRLSGKAELKLELTGILIHDNVVPIVTGEYEAAGKGRGGNTAKKAVGGAALGAIIGALAGGGRGAAIGAGAGAAAGTTINIITKGEKVKIPSETLLEFRLDAPLTLTAQSSVPR